MIKDRNLCDHDIFVLESRDLFDGKEWKVYGKFSHYDDKDENKFWAFKSVNEDGNWLKTELDWLLCGLGRTLREANDKEKEKFREIYLNSLSDLTLTRLEFQVAKLASEKGYDEWTDHYFIHILKNVKKKDGWEFNFNKGYIEKKCDEGLTNNKSLIPHNNKYCYCCIAPNYTKLCKWLRNEHGIDILIDKNSNTYQMSILKNNVPTNIHLISKDYELSYMDALIKSLSLI